MVRAPELPLVLTARQAAQHLGVGVNRLRRWANTGIVPSFIDPDTRYRSFFRPALDEWARRNGRGDAA